MHIKNVYFYKIAQAGFPVAKEKVLPLIFEEVKWTAVVE